MEERRAGSGEMLVEITELKSLVKQIDERTERMSKFIEGNGTPGAKVRLDRLEQTHKRQTGYHALWLSSIIGLITAWAQGWLK